MKPRLRHFLFLLTMTVGCRVQANGIRYIDYHPDRVPSIVTAPGIASEIIFEDDETIEYYTFGRNSRDSEWRHDRLSGSHVR